jgi:hypothetical protein
VIVESLGGITPHLRAHIGYLAKRARGKGARDATKYGSSRTSTKSYYVHHTQQLALAAVTYDAKAIRKYYRLRKREQMGATAGAA